jgi:hypothetical protein
MQAVVVVMQVVVIEEFINEGKMPKMQENT